MLGVLLTMTEQQGQSVSTLLAGLAEQVAALQDAVAAAHEAAESVAQSADEVTEAAQNAMPTLHEAAASAVTATVEKSLAESATSAADILEEACQPVVDRLTASAAAVASAEQKLHRAAASVGWKWAAIGCGALAVTFAAFAVAVWLGMTIQRGQITSLAQERSALQTDVAQLQQQVAVLEKKGARIKFGECGGRLCIEASSNQGSRAGKWKAPWHSAEGDALLVIPKGY